MELSVEDLGKLKRKISVEVPLADVEVTYESVYANLRTNIRVNGFRPGIRGPHAVAAHPHRSHIDAHFLRPDQPRVALRNGTRQRAALANVHPPHAIHAVATSFSPQPPDVGIGRSS